MSFKVYLSSTSYHWWNLKSFLWKTRLKSVLRKYNRNVGFIDPLLFKSENPIVCPKDINDIEHCNFIVVYLDKITIGTMMELSYCVFKNKDYCIYSTNKKVLKHPWIVHLCKDKIYSDINKVSKLINKKYIKRYGYKRK